MMDKLKALFSPKLDAKERHEQKYGIKEKKEKVFAQ